MKELRFQIGDIAYVEENPFRIIFISENIVVLCEMEITSLNLIEYEFKQFKDDITTGRVLIERINDDTAVIVETLDDAKRKKYETKLAIIKEVNNLYAPTYLKLQGIARKPEAKQIIKKYGLTKSTFWRLVRVYLQSGMKESSLLKRTREAKSSNQYYKKPGNPGNFGISTGCIVDDEIKKIFDIGLNYYKSGRAKSYQKAFDMINWEHFNTETLSNGQFSRTLLPVDQRPTFRQFYYYCQQRITEEEKDAIKTSRMEQRNNKRLLLGTDAQHAEFPGEKVECDAVEFDLSLISEINPGMTIGRPILYVMRDSLTHAVTAMSVGFDNNSVLGLTNLMLNLGDDKEEYCRKIGIELSDVRLWPSNFIPLEMYTDRGSDFKSDPFGRMCRELGIRRHIVTGGTGSMKGMIESWFHQMHSMINTHTENAGLIEKRYDSNHHKEAVLTLSEFTKMAVICLLSYNQSHMEGYMPRLQELRDKVDATPAELWAYYCKEKGSPRPITDRTSYLLKMLCKYTGSLSRKGISVKKLQYINYDDRKLLQKMYHLQNRKEQFEILYDPRDNSRIYYIDSESRLAVAVLNENIPWMKDIKGLTFIETDDYLKEKSRRDKEAIQRNDQIRADRFGMIESIVAEAKADPNRSLSPETEGMREARAIEKQMVNRENTITERLEKEHVLPGEKTKELTQQKEEEKKEKRAYADVSDEEYLDYVAHYDEFEENW